VNLLTFDPIEHRYFVDGKPVDNVTRALSLLVDWSKVKADVLENARQEGVAMHRTIELYEARDLDEETLPAWLKPRLDAYKAFKAETGFEVEASEERVYHPVYRYAGTADLFGRFERSRNPRKAVIDLKRSFAGGRAIGLQTAAYGEARRERERAGNSVGPYLRYALQLRADGSYRTQEYTNPRDFINFLAVLTTYRLREEMNA
jgi:hypothetical protein